MQKNLNNDDNRPCKTEKFIHYFEGASHSHIDRIPKTFFICVSSKSEAISVQKNFL